MLKFLRWTLLIIVALVLFAISASYIYLQSSRPVYHGELYYRGVYEEVKVYFDKYGIPHIYAHNEKDAYFTLGYLHAQERLFQMELLRRVGAGRLAEILGPDLVKTDAFFRTLGISKSARESATMFFSRPNEAWQKNTLSYLKGVNSFLFQGPTPPEFLLLGIPKVKFTPEDLYLITGYMSFSFTEAFRTDPILDLIKSKYGQAYLDAFEGAGTVAPADSAWQKTATDSSDLTPLAALADQLFNNIQLVPWLGSNAWVVGPTRSKSREVLFANDTHIGYQQPAVWYEAHMEFPGYEIYGKYLPGLPFPLIGQNRRIAWGLTMFENDDVNFYREKTEEGKSNKYFYKGSWENFILRRETIAVKGTPDTSILIRESVHGPVINQVVNTIDSMEASPVSVWWTFTKFPNTALQVTSQLSAANSIDDARDAASKVHAPGLNIVYGDRYGNIAWWAAARIPLLREGINTKVVLDGTSGADDVIGFLDFASNPHSENPESGYIISANQQPAADSGIHIPGYYAPPARYNRIRKLLGTSTLWTVEGFKKIQLDAVSDIHPAVAAKILAIVGEDQIRNMSPAHIRAATLLKNWNGNHRVSDLAPVIYYKLLSYLLQDAMKDELGELRYEILVNTHLMKNSYLSFISDSASGWWDDLGTPAVTESRKEICTRAFNQTVHDLTSQGNRLNESSWGVAHSVEHMHPLGKLKPLDKIFNVGPVPVPGGIETVNNAGFPLTTDGRYKVSYGPSMRNVLDLGDPDHGWSVSPTGQSGHVRSPHYSDQFKLHTTGTYRPMMMDRAEIQQTCTNILTFKPEH